MGYRELLGNWTPTMWKETWMMQGTSRSCYFDCSSSWVRWWKLVSWCSMSQSSDCEKLATENDFRCLENWSHQSPYLFPIGNLWHDIKFDLSRRQYHNYRDLANNVWDCCNSLTTERSPALVRSMPKSIQVVLVARCGHTKYWDERYFTLSLLFWIWYFVFCIFTVYSFYYISYTSYDVLFLEISK